MARLMRNPPEDERAQILLIGAFTLAVLLVVLAVVLNGVIYTGTASSQAGMTESHAAVQYEITSHDTLESLIFTINNESDGNPLTELEKAVADWNNLTARLSGSATVGTNATLTQRSSGYHIEQTNKTRNFTNANPDPDWDVATDIDEVHRFRMNISRDSLNTSCPSCFTVVFDEGTANEGTVAVQQDGSDINVSVTVPGTTDDCGANSTEWAVIDFVNNSIGGTPCDALADIDDPSDIRYENATDVNGTYALVVKTSADYNGDFVSEGEEGPVAAKIVYSAEIAVSYSTPRLSYSNTSIRVGPGDHID